MSSIDQTDPGQRQPGFHQPKPSTEHYDNSASGLGTPPTWLAPGGEDGTGSGPAGPPGPPGAPGGIQFDIDNVGDWLYVKTTGEAVYPDPAADQGILLENAGPGGLEIIQDDASILGITVQSTGGGIEINSTGATLSGGTGGPVRILNNSDNGGILIEDSGSGGDIEIRQDGNKKLKIRNTGGPDGILIQNDGNSPLEINNFGGAVPSAYIKLRNTGDGGIIIEDDGGGLNLSSFGDGLFFHGLPASYPGLGTDVVWNNSGLLRIGSSSRIPKRVLASVGPGATPTINTDNYDVVHLTGLFAAITSMTTNLTGTPVDGDEIRISFTDNGTARAITWGAKFEASTVALPTTTIASIRLDARFLWNTETLKWRCVTVA